MKKGLPIFVVVLLLTSVGTTMTSAAQSNITCNSVQGTEICIKNVNVSDKTVVNGGSTTLSIEIVNTGNQTGDGVLLMGTRQPEGGHTYSVLKEINNLQSGEEKDLSLTLPVKNSGPSGVHQMNFLVFDSGQEHLYDATGYSTSIVIKEDSINVLKWLKGLHYTIQVGIVAIPVLLGLIGWSSRG